MVLPGLKGNNMEILLTTLFVAFWVTFVTWVYLAVQVFRRKQPAWKMWVCVAVIWILNIGMHIVDEFI